MLYIIFTLAFVIGVPATFVLGQHRGVRLEQKKRWFGVSELDDLTPREALMLANLVTRGYYGEDPWEVKLRDHVTGAEFVVKNKSLPDLIAVQARHFAAQRALKELNS